MDLIAGLGLAIGAEAVNEQPVVVERVNKSDLDAVYSERNHIVAALARIFPSGIRKTDIPDWDPEWHHCVYVDLPTGQCSWHIHDSELPMFAGLPDYAKEWDGHDKTIVHQRLKALAALNCADFYVDRT